METFVGLLVLQFFQSVLLQKQPSPQHPVIQFCFSNKIPLTTGCELRPISNSVFEFEQYSKNILNTRARISEYLILVCRAQYPIRWLAHKPLGSLSYLPYHERVNLNQEDIQHSQWVFIILRLDFSRTLRCESYSDNSLAAEVFLTGNSTQLNRLKRQTLSTYFFVEENKTSQEIPDGFIIPCVGPELYDEHVVRLATSRRNVQVDINASRKSPKQTTKGVWSKYFNIDEAVIGGYEQHVGPAYVCRANTSNGEVIPGKYHTNEEVCIYALGNEEHRATSDDTYGFLMSPKSNSYAWSLKSNGAIEAGAVEGGLTIRNERTYICHGLVSMPSIQEVFLPGNLIPSERNCVIPFGSGQATFGYEVLIDTSFSCNAFCKTRSVNSEENKQNLPGVIDHNSVVEYRTSTGLWSDTFNGDTALKAGNEPDIGLAYVCRATTTAGEVMTGKYYNIRSSYQGCFYTNREREIHIQGHSTYQILTIDSTTIYGWLPRKNGAIAHGAVEGGRTLSGEITFVCRAVYEDGERNRTVLLPGYLVPSEGGCKIPYGGFQFLRSYEILVDAGCSCGSYIYDPRKGFHQTGTPDFQSKYTCYSQVGSTHLMYPISRQQEIRSNLYYGSKSNGDNRKSIRCDAETPYQNMELDILVGKCDSIIECDLKFSPMPPLVGFNDGLVKEDVEIFRSYNKNNGVISAHGHGYVQCTSKFPNSDERSPSGYIIKSDYMFIGLDNEIYFASKGFPNSSVVAVKNETQDITTGLMQKYACKISTFVLLPTISFEIDYSDGQPSKVVNIGSNEEDAFVTELPVDPEKLTKSWRLFLVLAKNVTKITCQAQWASSGRLISSEIDKNSKAETKNSKNESVVRDNSLLLKYVIIGCSVALVIFLAMVALYFVLWRKYQRSKELIRNLTEGEIYEFHNGMKTPERNKDGETPIESLAFNGDMVIMSNALKIAETEVLGKGEYGIVYKGIFGNQYVAVKSCQENADVDYFKAFLKEIKVMGYIGDHENIVKFHGAVVDRIRERQCLAVIELCPHGDLNNFLKRFLGSYSNLTPEVLFQPVDMIEMGSRNGSDQSVLKPSVLSSFCMQIASGMDFLSQKKVIHGDLATRNVLVFDNSVVKITDFGLSRKLYNCRNYTKTKQAPLPWRWMALESLRYFQFSTKSDVWSFGVTVWEIFSLAQVPFAGVTWTPQFADEIENGLRLSKPQLAPQHVFEWIMKCWENNQDSRPTFLECKEFFQHLILDTTDAQLYKN